MKSFNELVEIYDNALEEAKTMLPAPDLWSLDLIRVPVFLETSIIISLKDAKLLQDCTLNTPILTFEFQKCEHGGWVFNRSL